MVTRDFVVYKPLFQLAFRSSNSTMASKLIHNMQDLNSCPYYWANISRKEAWDVLEDKPLGSYLLRTCEDENIDIYFQCFYIGYKHEIQKVSCNII